MSVLADRRQFLLWSSAAVAAAALPAIVQAEPLIFPFADPHPEMTAAIKIYWDVKNEIFRTTAISFKELYINGEK